MTAEAALHGDAGVDLVTSPCTGSTRDALSVVERVAKIVSGTSVIGEARNALSAAGWTATIAANRITVGDEVLAQYIPAKVGTFGLVSGHWVIYSMVEARPVWIVGAGQGQSAPRDQRGVVRRVGAGDFLGSVVRRTADGQE